MKKIYSLLSIGVTPFENKKTHKPTFGILAALTMIVFSSCTKDVNDSTIAKSQDETLAQSAAVTVSGDSYACWYTSKIEVGHISQIQNSYIWVIQNTQPTQIDSDPSVNHNKLFFGSNTTPFHSNPAGKSMSQIKAWIISALTELGGSDPVTGQWDCSIDSSDPNLINVNIYNNGSGCGNVETSFPNYGNNIGSGVKTAVFISFDLVGG